ncbi:MAG: hypothetical protein K6T83_21145 [Alicyclobacillus sp.]|nr:hypothetical protein [Alicyclobacillus sp.]
MQNIACPHCGSDNVQNFPVLHAHGTSVIETTSHTVGIGAVGGRLGIGGGRTRHRGVEQTQIGAMTAPPGKKGLKWKIIGFLFFVYALIYTVVGHGPGYGILFSLIMLCVFGYFGYRTFQYNRMVWPTLYEQWTRKWLCNKCGNVFELYPGQQEAAATHE